MPVNCCPKCNRSDVEFPYAHKKSWTCRNCLRNTSREWMRKNRKVTQQRNRKSDSYALRCNTPENKAKVLARAKVRNAVRAGTFERLPCAVCGSEKSEAHHDDYNKPFDVMWLCRAHHCELHMKRRDSEREAA